jgi:hypothetical protein
MPQTSSFLYLAAHLKGLYFQKKKAVDEFQQHNLFISFTASFWRYI